MLNELLKNHFSVMARGLDQVPDGAQCRPVQETDETLRDLYLEMRGFPAKCQPYINNLISELNIDGCSISSGYPKGRWPTVYYVSFHDGISSTKPSNGVYPVIFLTADHKSIWTGLNVSVSELGFPPEVGQTDAGRQIIQNATRVWASGVTLPGEWHHGPLPLGWDGNRLPPRTRGVGPNYEVAAIGGIKSEVGQTMDFISHIKSAFDIIDLQKIAPAIDDEELNRRVERQRELSPALDSEPEGNQSPGSEQVLVTKIERDPRVKRWVLDNANGICELCNEQAPFQNKKGRWYLDVHHVVPLKEKGADTINNAVALCPNCHMRCHHSADSQEATNELYVKINRLVAYN
jgi:hypothetical protein